MASFADGQVMRRDKSAISYWLLGVSLQTINRDMQDLQDSSTAAVF